MAHPLPALTPAERALVARLRTPRQVQRWLDALPYNRGNVGKTLRPFRGVLAHKTAHCIEGALAAAFVLERHGWPPLLLDLSSSDGLDHVCFLYRGPRGWGTVSQSRYPGLRGRAPVFRSVRDLAWSYAEPFVDATGAVRGYATFDLRALGGMDWALSRRSVWRIEDAMLRNRHAPLRLSPARERALRRRYLAWKRGRPDAEPPRGFYANHERFL
jgi:hypothetical protein